MSDKNELNLEIDPERLADEWRGQPYLYWRWAKKAADAQQELDILKAVADVEKAELDRDIRDDPKSYGIEKLTETALSSSISATKSYQTAAKKVIEAKHKLDMTNAAVRAIEQRKKALELMTELWIRDYYVDPSPRPRSQLAEEWNKREARISGRRRREQADE